MAPDERISDCTNIKSPNNPRKIEEKPNRPKRTTGRKGETASARKPMRVTQEYDAICRAVNR